MSMTQSEAFDLEKGDSIYLRTVQNDKYATHSKMFTNGEKEYFLKVIFLALMGQNYVKIKIDDLHSSFVNSEMICTMRELYYDIPR